MSFADVMHEILYQDADITTILEADREAREKAGEAFVERVKQNFEEAKKGKAPKIEPITGSTIEAVYCSPTLAFGKRIAMVQSINDADGIRRISATTLSRDTDVKENVGVTLLGEDEIVTMAKGHREVAEIRRNFQNQVYGQCETQIDMILSKMKKVAQHIESSQKQDETKATLQGIVNVMGQTVESILKDFNNIFTVSDLSAQSFMKVSDNYLRISEKRLKQNPEVA
jgi:ribosomal protein S15P/S13E